MHMILRIEITEILRFLIQCSIYAKSNEKARTFGLLSQMRGKKMCFAMSALVFSGQMPFWHMQKPEIQCNENVPGVL